MANSEDRPWGRFEILREAPHFKTKIITVQPGEQISYQSHEKRHEHWVFVKGTGQVILNDQTTDVGAGSYISIPAQAKHRVRNTGTVPLEFVEVQLGEYFGEDDIQRFHDKYSRS